MNVLYEDLRFIKDYLLFNLRGIIDNKKDLKQFKNIHKGERCFIVATGPSLTLEDVEAIKGEYTFAVNSCFRIFDKTDWRPTYYVVTDPIFIHDLGDELFKYNNQLNCSFCSDIVPWDSENVHKINTTKQYQNMPSRGLLKKIIDLVQFDFMSSNICKGIYAGHTVLFSVLQLAEYMGFKDIYLIGVDCNYTGKTQYSSLTSHIHVNNPNAADLMIIDYLHAKRHFDKTHTSVYNATRGGMLEVFERVNLDIILSQRMNR